MCMWGVCVHECRHSPKEEVLGGCPVTGGADTREQSSLSVGNPNSWPPQEPHVPLKPSQLSRHLQDFLLSCKGEKHCAHSTVAFHSSSLDQYHFTSCPRLTSLDSSDKPGCTMVVLCDWPPVAEHPQGSSLLWVRISFLLFFFFFWGWVLKYF